jgi:hypothetical protein
MQKENVAVVTTHFMGTEKKQLYMIKRRQPVMAMEIGIVILWLVTQ